MYFDFQDYRPDTPRVETAISRREAIILSIFFHVAVILTIIFGPSLPSGGSAARAGRLALNDQSLQDRPQFVFVQPRADIEASRPPPRAEDSDKNRLLRSPERAPDPKNALPLSHGNSPERVEGNAAAPVARAQSPAEAATSGAGETKAAGGSFLTMPNARLAGPSPGEGRGASSGGLGEALRNLQRYVDGESFENPQGGGPFGPEIQFDTRGVEFGPWVRRFVAQVKRNWFIPYAAMAMKGHVVITFNVHRDGAISDLEVVGPSPVDAFNHAAYNALAASNPTQALPPEYPADHAFFTVTFYYNDTPPSY